MHIDVYRRTKQIDIDEAVAFLVNNEDSYLHDRIANGTNPEDFGLNSDYKLDTDIKHEVEKLINSNEVVCVRVDPIFPENLVDWYVYQIATHFFEVLCSMDCSDDFVYVIIV